MKNAPSIVAIMSSGHAGQSWLCMLIGSHSQAVAVGEAAGAFEHDDVGGICSLCDNACPFWREIQDRWLRGHSLLDQVAVTSGKSIVVATRVGRLRQDLASRPKGTVHPIRLIRDGRAVTASYLRKYPQSDYMKLASNWVADSIALDRWFESYPENARLVVRYEDLVADVELELKRVCELAGIAFEPGMVRYWEFKHHVVGVNKGTLSFVRRFHGLDDEPLTDDSFYREQEPGTFRDERWRSELTAEQQYCFDLVAGRQNVRYGYSRQLPALPLARRLALRWRRLLQRLRSACNGSRGAVQSVGSGPAPSRWKNGA